MTENVKVLYNHIGKVKEKVSGDELMRAIKAGGFVLEGWAKINANSVFSSKATNTLAGSITVLEDEKSETLASVDVGPTVVYGRIRELGGMITPIAAKMLSWMIGGGAGSGKQRVIGRRFVTEDGRVFAEAVQVDPTPYLRPAYDEHEADIWDTVGKHIKGEIEQVVE